MVEYMKNGIVFHNTVPPEKFLTAFPIVSPKNQSREREKKDENHEKIISSAVDVAYARLGASVRRVSRG